MSVCFAISYLGLDLYCFQPFCDKLICYNHIIAIKGTTR